MSREENSKIEKIIINLKSLHRNFDAYSKEKVLRSIIHLINVFSWKLTPDKKMLNELISELGDVLNIIYSITNGTYHLKSHVIKEKIYKIIKDFFDVIPLDDIDSPYKEYYTASEIYDLIEQATPPSNVILSREVVFKEKPEICSECNSNHIEFWGETDEEIVFECQQCGKHYPIPFDQSRPHFYFS